MTWALSAGTTATFQLGVYQDAGLLVTGLIGLAAAIVPARPLAQLKPVLCVES